MELLSLDLIGWLFTLGSGFALAVGSWLTIGMHFSGAEARKQLAARVLDDSILFGIWILGLAGGIGILLGRSWSAWVLELFCWTLMILMLLSAWTRLRAAPPPRTTLTLGLALFIVPIIAVCIATILTLRSETALRALTG